MKRDAPLYHLVIALMDPSSNLVATVGGGSLPKPVRLPGCSLPQPDSP